jgi:ribonuclease Z
MGDRNVACASPWRIFDTRLERVMDTLEAIHSPGDIRITLLGTGGPDLSMTRAGAAILIETCTDIFLIDAGRGVMQRLYECGIQINTVIKILFTHLHSDHIEGLPQLWMTSCFLLGRKTPMHFRGPVGTSDMLAGMRHFLGHDVTYRQQGHASALDYAVDEFTSESIVYENGDLTVTAVPVEHQDGNPAFGFVICTSRHKVVVSGDCVLSEDLIRVGQGADVVIHNVFAPSEALMARLPHVRAVTEKLAVPEQCGEVFLRTGTKLGVFTHVINVDSSNDDIVARARATGYAGPLVVGEDRMIIDVGDHVRVVQPSPLKDLPSISHRSQVLSH